MLKPSGVDTERSFISPQRLAELIDDQPSALFFDVDGTLLPIRERPTDVRSDEPLRTCLRALAARQGGALALVSGRAIDDLDRIFTPLVLPAAGMHGAEIRFADGTRERETPDRMDGCRPTVHAFVAAHPGLLLEDKGLTLAVHYRQRPELEAEVLATLSRLVAGSDLAVQRGKMVAEVKPAGIDKGRAIARLATQTPFTGRRPVFVGDDVTDESGFRHVNAAGGVSIRVGPAADPTDAHLNVPDVSAVLAVLHALRDHAAV